ncbi:hypothetical protein NKI11_30910, partial [Mesorhizobium sp. M0684]
RQSNSSLIRPDTVPNSKAIRRKRRRQRAGKIALTDDYGSALCPGARKAFDQFFENRPEGIIELPTGQAIVVKAS